ncbi:hypothetical protein SAMN05877753_101502 [Bacillus oleivorans]|uniref:Uncharacterized protein n=1 Tax=Bacillus oleivorans TaxID=1448271 RepID=A0A285CIK7_9BACI|nr:hypothetical protein [Bacillus oleivorans]SNX67185.1 hypothetical protein SAMN05877753_101502 [Bacillus oleivorans]
MKVCSPNTRICAMCFHWNGYAGGANVKPRKGMRNVYEYQPEEKQICYKNHFEKKAWNSCNEWQRKY